MKRFVHKDDDPLCRSLFFSPTAPLMSRSQTSVWASYSRSFLRPRTCTSIRTTVLRLKTRELACGNFKVGLGYNYYNSPNLAPPPSPSYFSVVGSGEFETVTCAIHLLHIVWTWKVKSSVAQFGIGPTRFSCHRRYYAPSPSTRKVSGARRGAFAPVNDSFHISYYSKVFTIDLARSLAS